MTFHYVKAHSIDIFKKKIFFLVTVIIKFSQIDDTDSKSMVSTMVHDDCFGLQ